MSLLKNFISTLESWRFAFCKEQAFKRAQEHAITSLCAFGRHTITNFAIFLGRSNKIPTADYKLYTERKWDVEHLFNPILQKSLRFFEEGYIIAAADDTKLHKTGKKIPHASWQRDPMSPPFHTNLIWGLRFLQMSVCLPLYKASDVPCRSIPIRFVEASSLKKPGKKSSDEERKQYAQLKKTHNLSTLFVKELRALRDTLDTMGATDKKLLMTVDGSYCNSTCMGADIPNTYLVARCRKDTRLCKPYIGTKRKFYDETKFTPENVRQDESIPWQEGQFYYGGDWRILRYKEVNQVLWQRGTKRKLLRLIVLAPLPYVRGGRRNYRDPAYLLSTDLEGPVVLLIQSYLDHWQIEYNHRDEKSIIGVGEAQVRNENAVEKQPGLHVAAYSALCLASVLTYGDKHHEDFGEQPAWRKKPKRNTCRALVGQMRANFLEHPEELIELNLTKPAIVAILRMSA